MNVNELVKSLVDAFNKGAAPPPDILISEYADQSRIIPQTSGDEYGLWRTSKTPYLKEMMDVMSPSSPVQSLVCMKGTQMGWTEFIINCIDYYIEHDPCSMILINPTDHMSKRFVKQRLNPSIQLMPGVLAKIKAGGSGDKGDTLSMKEYLGGVLLMAGAGSAAEVCSMPAKNAFIDEWDRCPVSVGNEGNLKELIDARTTNFTNSKKMYGGSPTETQTSLVYKEYMLRDQRKYYVPCPECEFKQKIVFEQLKEEKDDVYLECEKCSVSIPEREKPWMLENGVWIPENKDADPLHRSYHIPGLYSPWQEWSYIFEKYKGSRMDNEKLKTFHNLQLGEPFEEKGNRLNATDLYNRMEHYDAPVPKDAYVLYGTADIHDQSIHFKVMGWGLGKEGWLVDYQIFKGDTSHKEVWDTLDDAFAREYKWERGGEMGILGGLVDAGYGKRTHEAYQFCRGKEGRRIFPIKGSSAPGKELISKPSANVMKKHGVALFIIGTENAKMWVFSNLANGTSKNGKIHFPNNLGLTEKYFEEICSEELVMKKRNGKNVMVFSQFRKNNHALDLLSYNYAGFMSLKINMEDYIRRLRQPAKKKAMEQYKQQQPMMKSSGRKIRRKY